MSPVLPYPMMTVRQVAKQLQLADRTVYSYIQNGQLRAARLPGGDYRVRQSDFETFVDSLFGKVANQVAEDKQATEALRHVGENTRAKSLFERGREAASKKPDQG